MRYDKPWLSLEEQADLLAQRSLEGDRAVVIGVKAQKVCS